LRVTSDVASGRDRPWRAWEEVVMTRSKIAGTGIVVVAIAGAAWALLGKSEKKTSGFLTAFVDRGTIIQSVATTGTLTAVTTVKVGSQVSGIIATLHLALRKINGAAINSHGGPSFKSALFKTQVFKILGEKFRCHIPSAPCRKMR